MSQVRRALACAAFLSLVSGAAAQGIAGSDSIRTRTLDNGLRIIVWPDPDIPNVALYNFVRAGSRNEVPGLTGISHFFEHMMFNGTRGSKAGAFDQIMEASGGSNNAYTSSDMTVYQDWFAASALPTVLDLEADRLANLSFDPEVVESERGVVTSERRSSVDNSNGGALYEMTKATAFVAHPYQTPIIGWPSDIASWTIDDLQSYFKTYYAPNNLTFVIVGDVDPDQVFALMKTKLGGLSAQDPPPPVRTVEPPQNGERRVEIIKSVQTPLVQVAFKGPAAADPTTPAVDLLLHILGDGDSSRLHQRLVEKERLAIGVGTYLQISFDPGMAWVFMTLPQGADPAAAEAVLYEELRRIAQEGVTAKELAKARKNVLASFWRQMATINGKAEALGEYEMYYGGYEELFKAPERYAQVTAEELQAVAKELFDPKRRTVGVMKSPAKGEGS